jgi:uncharacterized protein (DUF2267 family)
MTNLFDKHYQEASRFIRKLAMRIGTPGDTDHAIRVLKSVFITLRRKLIPDDSLNIVSQLPLVVKGIYVDGWNINEPLLEAQTYDEFLYELRHNTVRRADIDFGNDDLAKKKITAVFTSLREYIPVGELNHIREELPKEVAEMV